MVGLGMLGKLIRMASNFWLVVLFLAIGWGPLFVAEFVRTARPDLDASYVPQHFAMQWMRTAALFSLLAIVAAAVWVVRFVLRHFVAAKDTEKLSL
jgi:hypothetical protein